MTRTSDQSPKSATEENWCAVVDLVAAGDRRAYGQLVRLVTGHLAHWRAYDFSADWDDIVQEVILSVVQAHAKGKLDAPGALRAYARQATRFKFIDRIRASKRQRLRADPGEIERQAESAWPPLTSVEEIAIEMRLTLRRAIETLPEPERLAVIEVHARGRTYEEAANATGIPLGSLKRSLRSGLATLRERLGSDPAG